MSRARATALALVNWKGVFYERYQLDRRVTALEGANGSGKTTVMIAAYVVLLPDMSRLRFTNLGETAATGGDRGIWGRLGEATRPAYAALELDLGDGVRVVAGVLLARKSEPSVELTPFLFSQLAPTVRLQDLLLVVSDDEEHVPELSELRSNASSAGAKLEVFASAKDYFAALFELGIGALRLASDDDRGRLGDMLRTSMTGGISRAITSELRSFLLREQGGVGDTLGRMRENLSACRRTRLEVSEAQLLEQEISGVYDAGQGMFAAALQAAREHARERGQAAARLGEGLARSRRLKAELALAVSELEDQERSLAARLQEQRAALEELRDRARTALSLAGLREKLQGIEHEREASQLQVTRAREAQLQASSTRETEKRLRDAAHRNYEQAAHGLADLQAGLDELHRRASAYRKAQRALAEVNALAGQAAPAAADVGQLLLSTRARLCDLDSERLAHERSLALVSQRQHEWQQALKVLESLGQSAAAAGAFELARETLRELAATELLLGQLPALTAELDTKQALAERQLQAEQAALALGLELEPGRMLERIEAQLSACDEDCAGLEQQQRALEEVRQTCARERELFGEQMARAQSDLGKYRRLLQLLERVRSTTGHVAPAREALLRVRDSLSAERPELGARLEQWSLTRERLLREANQYEASGGQFPEALLKLRDDLDGELLGSRFEELDLPEAARLEALLGPLTHAIVVEDLSLATERLRDKPRELHELRLIAAGTELDVLKRSEHTKAGLDLCVQEGPALRITRLPERATLGRRAREARILELRRQALDVTQQLEPMQLRLRSVTSALADLDQLLPEADLLERGDPAMAHESLASRLQALSEAEQLRDKSERELSARLSVLRTGGSRYRALLSEAFLLDAERHSERAQQLTQQLAGLQHAAERLARSEPARRKLEALQDSLRVPPPSPDELRALEEARSRLGSERDQSFRLIEALEQLQAELPALAWQDAELALQGSEQVAPALEEQHERARTAVAQAEDAVLAAEATWETATTALQHSEAELAAIVAHAERLRQDYESSGLSADFAPERAAKLVHALTEQTQQLERDERALLSTRGAQSERLRQLAQDEQAAERALQVALREAEPAERRWLALRAQAEGARVLHSGESSEREATPSAIELSAEARSRAALLQDRLATARGGEALARELADVSLDDDASFLEVWLRVREWLARRVPAQVAQVEDPLLALERLRGHLSVLEQRLTHQEGDLRGASEDVARGIEVQLRRAKAQVRRLNQNLAGVSFGSIAGIRAEFRRSQQMEPVLRALAEGSAQELLFQSNLPMEEALSEILRRFGGGRGGGSRLLDYREYLELVVEVQRKADGAWEPANPTRLSTGEAIGVGAALMMVVLAEWERDANLLRSRRGPGSLRFLFLDEANRLSQDNLSSLFDLCESLDLQLLIAAPEVARASGNTTYRLVRKVTEQGREEVIVSGRRALSAEPFSTPSAPSAPVQGVLFEH